MHIIKQITLSLLIALPGFAQQPVHIKAKLLNADNQVLIEDMSEFQYLLPPPANMIIVPDASGNFEVTLPLKKPGYYRVGRCILYLTPGDDLGGIMDTRNSEKSSYTGKGSEASNYLRNTPFPKAGSYIGDVPATIKSPEAIVAALITIKDERDAAVKALQNVSAEFKRLETARNRADLVNSLHAGAMYSIMKLRIPKEEADAFTKEFNKAAEPVEAKYSKGFVDPTLMQLVVYRDIADGLTPRNTAIKDWYKTSTLVRAMQKLSDKQILNTFKDSIAKIQTTAYKNAASTMLKHLTAFGKGDQAMDFTATDLNGKAVNLSSLKGKVIYVDLWATWCGPCMAEMPAYAKLKEHFKDNPDVVFVSVSIDTEIDLWKSSVDRHKFYGYQWQINRNGLIAYNVVNIPRMILIDKNFKIADMSAPLPSDTKVVQAINALL